MKCGFIGLGNMGAPMAANLAATGCQPIVYDKAGTAERAPEGAIQAASLAEVTAAETVFLSLPDGPVVAAVAAEIAASNQRRTTAVIDTSTIGVEAAQSIWRELDGAGIGFCDAPVSGGTAGATKAIEILRRELDLVMGQIGVADLASLNESFIFKG